MNGIPSSTRKDLQRFYAALDELKRRTGPARRLADYKRADLGTTRGVYFFFQDGENRSGSGEGQRVVRIGTHGLKAVSKSTLWSRLSQHRGSLKGGGNQRGSVFRRHVGRALMGSGLTQTISGWETGSSASAAQRHAERPAEEEVSKVIRSMSLLYLRIDDEPGPGSERGYVERNAISLLTSPDAKAFDPPSHAWLGRHAPSPKIRTSGLWNVNHVHDAVEAGFLERFEIVVREAG